MFVRLAFATSTAVDPQILLLDEVMAAGDAAFIESARRRMNELMERASIVVFASHSLDVLPTFCDRTILLKQGPDRRRRPDGGSGAACIPKARRRTRETQPLCRRLRVGAGG